MAVQIHRLTGATPTTTNITDINTRANAADSHSTAGTTNPVRKPDSGTNYSYWVSTQLYFDGTGTGTIDNIEWYSDGDNGLGTGITCFGNDASAYVQATGTEGETGTELTTGNHANLSGAPVDVFGLTSASPKTISGSVTDPSSELFGSLFVYQIRVGSTASAGASASESFTFRYDSTIS